MRCLCRVCPPKRPCMCPTRSPRPCPTQERVRSDGGFRRCPLLTQIGRSPPQHGAGFRPLPGVRRTWSICTRLCRGRTARRPVVRPSRGGAAATRREPPAGADWVVPLLSLASTRFFFLWCCSFCWLPLFFFLYSSFWGRWATGFLRLGGIALVVLYFCPSFDNRITCRKRIPRGTYRMARRALCASGTRVAAHPARAGRPGVVWSGPGLRRTAV